jgi:transposase
VCDAIQLNVLFPHLAALRIEGLSHEEGLVCLRARAYADEAPCPACGMASARVHSWYERRLADAPVAGQQVLIRLRVRRFTCQTLYCARQIFCEQLGGLTVRHGRRSLQLVEVLVAFALAGRAGARLARQTAITVSRSTLLRVLRAAPEPKGTTPRHHACLREPVAEDEQATVATPVVAAPVRESRLVVRTQQRYAAVQERLAAGCSISQISRELDLERGTVHRFARAGSLDELLVKTTTRETQLDGFEPYLQRRWNEGCMNATRRPRTRLRISEARWKSQRDHPSPITEQAGQAAEASSGTLNRELLFGR